MNYCSCKKCNKIFNYFKGPKLCEKCDDEIFNIIKNYIKSNKQVTTSELSRKLNIPLKIVSDYIKDDRILQIRKDSVNLCLLCGNPIPDNSNYCYSCQNKINLINELNTFSSSKKQNIPKMHFLSNNNTRKR